MLKKFCQHYLLACLIVMSGLLIIPSESRAEEPSLVITEVNKIQEYVVLYNAGQHAQELTGWSLIFENGGHKCNLAGTIESQARLVVQLLAAKAAQGGYNCGFSQAILNGQSTAQVILLNDSGRPTGSSTTNFQLAINATYHQYNILSWTAVSRATVYWVLRGPVGQLKKVIVETNQIYHHDAADLPVGQRYCYQVLALEGNRQLAASNIVCKMIYLPINLTVRTGVNNNYLRWNAINSAYVDYYQIERWARNGSNAFTTLTTMTTKELYFFDEAQLQAGQQYCYAVTAIDLWGERLKSSNTVCVTVGQVELWLPDLVVKPGTRQVSVPLNIRNARGLRLGNADFWLTFDQSMVIPHTVRPALLTAPNYMFQYTNPQNHLMRIATVASNPPPLQGAGSLLWVTFQITNASRQETALILRPFEPGVGGTVIGNELAQRVPLKITNGSLQIGTRYILGDVDGDGVVNSFDASRTLLWANSQTPPPDKIRQAGDINSNGLIDAADATMILYFAVHEAWPSTSGSRQRHQSAPTETRQTAPTFSLSKTSGRPGGMVRLTLATTQLSNWAGGSIAIAYDNRIVEQVEQVGLRGMAEQFGLNYTDDGSGLLKISLAHSAAIGGRGAILDISLKLRPEASVGHQSPVQLSEVRLNDLSGRDLATEIWQQALSRQHGLITVTEGAIYLPLVVRKNN